MQLIIDRKISSSFKEAGGLAVEAVDYLKDNHFVTDPEALFRVSFMLREILNNSVEHGNKFDLKKHISLKVYITKYKLTFEIQDEGQGYNQKGKVLVDDFTGRERTRGISTLEEMNFHIVKNGNKTIISMYLGEKL